MKFLIERMTCQHCVDTLNNAISRALGVESFEVSLAEHWASVSGSFDP
ncbi:MAG: heavy-metal-associated domain-containing protein [Deltaproteobacteria bacterium]|nr:heavy-metal-associated domain-containing protein [Deltaproteobacteria bacterium]